MAHEGMCRGALEVSTSGLKICGSATCSAPSAGQIATHARQPVHSADLTVMSWSTDRLDGQLMYVTEVTFQLARRVAALSLLNPLTPRKPADA